MTRNGPQERSLSRPQKQLNTKKGLELQTAFGRQLAAYFLLWSVQAKGNNTPFVEAPRNTQIINTRGKGDGKGGPQREPSQPTKKEEKKTQKVRVELQATFAGVQARGNDTPFVEASRNKQQRTTHGGGRREGRRATNRPLPTNNRRKKKQKRKRKKRKKRVELQATFAGNLHRTLLWSV